MCIYNNCHITGDRFISFWTFVGKDIPKNVHWGQIREGERQNQAFIKEFILVFSVTM